MTQQMEQEQEALDLTEVYGASGTKVDELIKAHSFAKTKSETASICDEIIGRMIELEAGIDAIADTAAAKISRKAGYLNYLIGFWTPFLTASGKAFIPKNDDGTYKKKNHKFDTGGVYFRKTGGWRIVDTAALKKHLSTKTVEELMALGCEPDIKIGRKAVLDYCKSTGEIMPGIEYEQEDEFGSLKVGAAKGWSPRGALDRLKAAFKRVADDYDQEGE